MHFSSKGVAKLMGQDVAAPCPIVGVLKFVTHIHSYQFWPFYLFRKNQEQILGGRVAEVGKLSASAKNAFNSFVGRVFANSRQKTLFFRVLPKLQQKGSFYLVLPSFYLVLPSFTQFLPSFTQFLLVLPSFYLVLPSFYLVFTRQGLKFSSESKLFVKRRLRNSCHPGPKIF